MTISVKKAITHEISGQTLTIGELRAFVNSFTELDPNTPVTGTIGESQRDGAYYRLTVRIEETLT